MEQMSRFDCLDCAVLESPRRWPRDSPSSPPESTAPSAARAGAVRLWNSAWALLILGNLLWASNVIVGRVIVVSVPPAALSFWRWAGAFTVAFAFAWPRLKEDRLVLRTHWKILLALAATGIAAFNLAAYIGLAGTTALNVLLMQSSLPLVVTAWIFALFGERPGARQLTAVMISLVGVMFIAVHGSWNDLLGWHFRQADLWVFASVVIYGAYAALLRRRPSVHPLSLMQVTMGLGVIMLAPAYIWEAAHGIRMVGGWRDAAGILYMSVFPSFISYLFFNRAVQLTGSSRAGHSMHMIPIFGSLMAVFCLGEALRVFHFVGAVAIAAGILLAQIPARPMASRARRELSLIPSVPE